MITLSEIIERDKRPISVTVYMICYNHSKYIDQAIQSVLMQKTNFPVNIVIHDDASPDGSGEIIRRYAAENPNITPIIEATNCMQNGKPFFPIVLPYLTGKYIAYLECDDYWLDEHKLQIQVDYLESNPDCIAVCSNTLPVNKFGEYDESARTGWNPKTGEGDYSPSNAICGVKHQIGTYVIRNFWTFMPKEEINYYISTRTNGDTKLLVLCLSLGRLHYFKQELSAYRHVVDEGDSHCARISRLGDYDKLKRRALTLSELCMFIEHFLGQKHPMGYIHVMFAELKGRIRYHKSVIEDAKLNPRYHLKNIPWYMYVAFMFYLGFRFLRKAIKLILSPFKKKKLPDIK